MKKYKFDLEENVQLVMSGEKGFVIGRAEYLETVNNYLVRYVTADGSQIESWFCEGALERQA